MKSIRIIAFFTSICLALALSPSAQAKAKPKAFNGKICTIIGTSKNEKLTGTSKPDVICGLGGNDTISGSGGNDTIDGGVGNDKLSGGNGTDILFGGNGNDVANGGNGNDSLIGANGDDSLNGQAGKDTYDGGNGLNSCYVEENEKRDFTCSLLPNLTYLLKRVSGEIESPGYDFAGCDISLYRTGKPGGPVVQAVILGKNKFKFDAPAGNYDWLVSGSSNGRGVGGSSTCNVKPDGISIWARSQIVSDNTPSITFSIPRLVKTRVYVRNSLGTPLRGALLDLKTSYGNFDPTSCPIAVTNMCGSITWGVDDASDPQPRTNSSGYYEVLLPEGVKLKASGQAIFAGITMETDSVQDVVLSYPSTNIDLVIQ